MSSDDKQPRGDEPREDGPDSPVSPDAIDSPDSPDSTDSPDSPEADEASDDVPPSPTLGEQPAGTVSRDDPPASEPEASDEGEAAKPTYYDDPYDDYDYEYDDPAKTSPETAVAKAEPAPAKTPPPPPPPTTDLDEDDEEEGMARMSFLEHLEELRDRIIRAFGGMLVAYLLALVFAKDLFELFVRPFYQATAGLSYVPPLTLIQLTPTELFKFQYIWIPFLAGLFIGAPWIVYQVWGFIAPGLYPRERKWATPFIFCTAGLFILGGLFCYFVALRLALAFLLGIAVETDVRPMIQLTFYYDMFFNLHVGLGVVFQMPVVIFFFTLLRITTPGFLVRNGRYAILIIFIVAAIITPTPDVTTMLTFAAPMILLYYVGIAASYPIVLRREGKSLPWGWMLLVLLVLAAIAAGIGYYMHAQLGYEFIRSWPFLVAPQ